MINYKIFQIGFNRCGTVSLFNLFNKHASPKIKCIHHDSGELARTIYNNKNQKRKLLDKKYEEYQFFSDMEGSLSINNTKKMIWSFKYFRELDEQYPNSKFILNIRNIDDWIRSRLNHGCSKLYTECSKEFFKQNKIISFSKFLVPSWVNEWKEHTRNVIRYFKGRTRDLLIFDIDNDPFDKIKNFFYDFKFNVNKLPWENKTKKDEKKD